MDAVDESVVEAVAEAVAEADYMVFERKNSLMQ
jgi:hypothetical protein